MQLTKRLSGRTNELREHGPLLVAIHGGTYTSAYFDVPGCSLLERAAINGVSAVAIDRPGYADSPMLPTGQMTLAEQGAFLRTALGEVWDELGGGHEGIVLIGHSIGAAIAATIASLQPDWPLLGMALSGVGLTTTPGDHERWQSLPDIPLVELPAEVKDMVMFGPEGSFDPAMPAATHSANAPAPKAELLGITGVWHDDAPGVLGRIRVPVHYRQAQFDRLWIVDQSQIDGFAAALSAAPFVDARLTTGAGHCIDFHHLGAAFQLQQLGFALECAAR